MGGPIFVPGGRRYSNWKIVGMGGSRGGSAATSVTVSARNLRQDGLDVETSIEIPHMPDSWRVGEILSDAVPVEVHLPFSVTVSERILSVRCGAKQTLKLRALITDITWIAFGPVQDRWIEIQGRGVQPELAEIRGVADLSSVPDDRWA